MARCAPSTRLRKHARVPATTTRCCPATTAPAQDRLEPLIDAEAARREFDIRVYGDELLGRLASAAPVRAAASTEVELPPADVPTLPGDAAEVSVLSSAASTAAAAEPAPNVELPFTALVGGGERYEVCRAFLAALQVRARGGGRGVCV